eukprot:11351511-Ditylum_brightwellii.AAC.1
MGNSTVGGYYKFTDRIPILDSLFEIPIALFCHPLSTVLLWLMFAAVCVAMFFIFKEYQETHQDKNASATANAAVFLNTIIVALYHLYKLTGGLSQYW